MTEPTKTPGANAESAPLNLRAPHDVIARLTRVASKLPPGLFSRHRLAVLALEHGLAVIERDPMILLRGPASDPVVPDVEPPSAPVAPAPEARVERVERASRAVPTVASAPVVDPRQLPLTAAASDAASNAVVSELSADVDALTHANDALRVRYRAGVAAKQVTPREVWEAIGDKGESTLRMWAAGKSKNVSAARLAAIASVLDAKGVPA